MGGHNFAGGGGGQQESRVVGGGLPVVLSRESSLTVLESLPQSLTILDYKGMK